jgi:hypothetical protein
LINRSGISYGGNHAGTRRLESAGDRGDGVLRTTAANVADMT